MSQSTRLTATILCFLVLLTPRSLQGQQQPSTETTLSRIAFGSCGKQYKRQPILKRVVETKPDLFIYLGDNVYGDTRDMALLQKKYDRLASKSEFKALCKAMPVLATWDDHDYGENDAGRHYPLKAESKEIFLDFWNEPAASPRRDHAGIYHAHVLGPVGRRVQVILLDTRTFRDDLKLGAPPSWLNDYQPNENPDSTFLGEAQWKWLEEQLLQPAEFRIVASSNQFAHSFNGWESWTNVPHEQAKFLDLIAKTQAEGLFFISGDVHWAELSRMESEIVYPIYDLTSSGITQSWRKVEANANRIGESYWKNNFGLIEIDWEEADPLLSLSLRNVAGNEVLKQQVRRSELSWK